ncbi:hypothetical protein IWX91DRAFT_65702 [Phyllosticta citricarpa]
MALRRGFGRCIITAVGSCHLARSSRRNYMNGVHSFTLPTMKRSSFPRGPRHTLHASFHPTAVKERAGARAVVCLAWGWWVALMVRHGCRAVRCTPLPSFLPSFSLAPSCGAHHDAQSLFFFFFLSFLFLFRLAWPIKGNGGGLLRSLQFRRLTRTSLRRQCPPARGRRRDGECGGSGSERERERERERKREKERERQAFTKHDAPPVAAARPTKPR